MHKHIHILTYQQRRQMFVTTTVTVRFWFVQFCANYVSSIKLPIRCRNDCSTSLPLKSFVTIFWIAMLPFLNFLFWILSFRFHITVWANHCLRSSRVPSKWHLDVAAINTHLKWHKSRSRSILITINTDANADVDVDVIRSARTHAALSCESLRVIYCINEVYLYVNILYMRCRCM